MNTMSPMNTIGSVGRSKMMNAPAAGPFRSYSNAGQ
jgi:hypothetical protein